MTTKMLRLPALAHERAVALAQLTGQSIGAVVSEAIDRAYRDAFWQAVEAQTAQTRQADPAGWAQYQAEAAEWDEATDTLDDDVPAVRSDVEPADDAGPGQVRRTRRAG